MNTDQMRAQVFGIVMEHNPTAVVDALYAEVSDLRAEIERLDAVCEKLIDEKQALAAQRDGTALTRANTRIEALTTDNEILRQRVEAQKDGVRHLMATDTLEQMMAFSERGDKIGAIKVVRQASGASLKEAKDYVEFITDATSHRR